MEVVEMKYIDVERVLRLSMKIYNDYPCEEIEESLFRVREKDKNCIIAGLIYQNYLDTACVENYKKGYENCVENYKKEYEKKEEEVKQLKEKLCEADGENWSLKRKISLLEKESCKLASVTENSMKNNISYRADVDTKAIHALLEKNYSKSEIAEKLGVSRQTIYRRLKENK